MNIFTSIYYIRCNRYLRFCGHWPYQSLKNKVVNLSLLMLLASTIIIPQSVKLFQLRNNFHNFVLAIPSMVFYAQFVFKNLFAALRMKQIKEALEKIKQDFNVYKDEDLQILHDYSIEAYKINTFYTVYMYMAVAGYSILPFTLHALDITVPRNESRLPQKPRLTTYFVESINENIFLMLIHGVIVDMIAIMFIIGFDTLYFAISNHVCALFVILINRMRDLILVKTDVKTSNSKKDQDIFYRNLVQCVVMHKYVLDFVQTLESAFSALNLFSIGCAMIPLTITGFQVILNNGNFGEMVRYVLFALGEIVHLFYYNWPGQKIRDHSLLICQACYNYEWYDEAISYKCKKILSLMMVRSQKPCHLTAGKLYILGLENFAAVVRLSMSYFTVLSSVM